MNSDIREKALNQIDLLEKVANHKDIYFPAGWARYETARKGTLKLYPLGRVVNELEEDYSAMAAMFYRERPDWKTIIETIQKFEDEFNRNK